MLPFFSNLYLSMLEHARTLDHKIRADRYFDHIEHCAACQEKGVLKCATGSWLQRDAYWNRTGGYPDGC